MTAKQAAAAAKPKSEKTPAPKASAAADPGSEAGAGAKAAPDDGTAAKAVPDDGTAAKAAGPETKAKAEDAPVKVLVEAKEPGYYGGKLRKPGDKPFEVDETALAKASWMAPFEVPAAEGEAADAKPEKDPAGKGDGAK